MDYKLVSFDLDGTLLNSKQKITIDTINIIKLLKAMGVTIAINTGRSFNASIYYGKLINADYIIGCNGAFIYDFNNMHCGDTYPITQDSVIQILELLYNYKNTIKIQWDSMDTYYSNNITPFEENYIQNYKKDFPDDKFIFEIINNAEDFNCFKNKEIYQVFFHPLGEHKNDYEKVLYELQKIGGINLVDFSKSYTDINCVDASKGKALSTLAKRLDLMPKDILAFGDGDNDITMFEYAGCAVAVDNACMELKKTADIITGNHDTGGVASALSEIYNLKSIWE